MRTDEAEDRINLRSRQEENKVNEGQEVDGAEEDAKQLWDQIHSCLALNTFITDPGLEQEQVGDCSSVNQLDRAALVAVTSREGEQVMDYSNLTSKTTKNISECEKEYTWKNDNSDEEKMVDMLATLLAFSSMTTERKTEDSFGCNKMNKMPKGITNYTSRKAEEEIKTEKNDNDIEEDEVDVWATPRASWRSTSDGYIHCKVESPGYARVQRRPGGGGEGVAEGVTGGGAGIFTSQVTLSYTKVGQASEQVMEKLCPVLPWRLISDAARRVFSLEWQVGGSAREINVPGGDQDRVTLLALGVNTE